MGTQAIDNLVGIRASTNESSIPIVGYLNLVEVTKIDGDALLNGIYRGCACMAPIDSQEGQTELVGQFDLQKAG